MKVRKWVIVALAIPLLGFSFMKSAEYIGRGYPDMDQAYIDALAANDTLHFVPTNVDGNKFRAYRWLFTTSTTTPAGFKPIKVLFWDKGGADTLDIPYSTSAPDTIWGCSMEFERIVPADSIDAYADDSWAADGSCEWTITALGD